MSGTYRGAGVHTQSRLHLFFFRERALRICIDYVRNIYHDGLNIANCHCFSACCSPHHYCTWASSISLVDIPIAVRDPSGKNAGAALCSIKPSIVLDVSEIATNDFMNTAREAMQVVIPAVKPEVTIDEQVKQTGRQDNRLLRRIVEDRLEDNSVLVDSCQVMLSWAA